MARIVAVSPVLPVHAYDQAAITAAIAPLLTSDPVRRAAIQRLHTASGVGRRHLALPLERYAAPMSFGQSNDVFIAAGLDLAEEAVRHGLKQSGLAPDDIDLLMFTSVTGIAAPSLDALLAGRLGLRPDVKRIPVFGLGCVAGAAGIARLHDHLVGHPDDIAVLVSVELCSLTLQRDDDSLANAISSGLFGDGAAAVVMAGARRADELGMPGPEVLATRSCLFPGTEGLLGWDVVDTGFRIVLSPVLPDAVATHLGPAVASFLTAHGLTTADVGTWLAHTGGPRILEAAGRSIGLPPAALARSRAGLERAGNLSSSGVLHVLADALASDDAPPGSLAVMFAIGPGVSAELVLLRWGGRP